MVRPEARIEGGWFSQRKPECHLSPTLHLRAIKLSNLVWVMKVIRPNSAAGAARNVVKSIALYGSVRLFNGALRLAKPQSHLLPLE
jgi:hypothetical protein